MRDAEQRTLIDRYISAYNAFEIEGMLSTLTVNVRFENHSSQQPTVVVDGRDAFRELAEHSAAVFSEREQRILSIDFSPSSAVAEIAFRGVLAATASSRQDSRVIDLVGSTKFTFENGLISKIVDRS